MLDAIRASSVTFREDWFRDDATGARHVNFIQIVKEPVPNLSQDQWK